MQVRNVLYDLTLCCYSKSCTAILPVKRSDILLLEEGQCLHHTHMEEAAQLMREQFELDIEVAIFVSTAGFRISKAQVVFLLVETQENNIIGHWVCLHFNHLHQKIQICDSGSNISKKWNSDLRKAVKQLFGHSFSTALMPSPQQDGGTHCGLYTIANALCICSGHVFPSGYDQKQMLPYLKKCIENWLFSETFPEKACIGVFL